MIYFKDNCIKEDSMYTLSNTKHKPTHTLLFCSVGFQFEHFGKRFFGARVDEIWFSFRAKKIPSHYTQWLEANEQEQSLHIPATCRECCWVRFSVKRISNNQEMFLPKAKKLPVHCTVGDDILEADKHLSIHVQFIDCRVDGISTRSVTLVSVSIGNNQEDSAASLKHFPVCGAECLGWERNYTTGVVEACVRTWKQIKA